MKFQYSFSSTFFIHFFLSLVLQSDLKLEQVPDPEHQRRITGIRIRIRIRNRQSEPILCGTAAVVGSDTQKCIV
jgi:hypothetical protein